MRSLSDVEQEQLLKAKSRAIDSAIFMVIMNVKSSNVISPKGGLTRPLLIKYSSVFYLFLSVFCFFLFLQGKNAVI